jgi:alpha-methylacyl-CoA racemase
MSPGDAMPEQRGGPLRGLRVVQLAGLGPVAFCGQLLGDLGADVVRIDPPQARPDWGYNARNRRSIVVDLKSEPGLATALRLAGQADVLVEGFRPGVVERLGIGPTPCRTINERLVYARCSGWGREGPLVGDAAHDLGYLALAGTLSLIGAPGTPPPSLLGLVGDRGGGGMLLTVGLLGALVERSLSGFGQVVDTSVLDGALAVTGAYYEALAKGHRTAERWSYGTDGAAPYYATYAASDGRYVAVSAVEPEFYRDLLDVLGLTGEDLPEQDDRTAWPRMRQTFAARIASRTRDEWAASGERRDACLTPVLTLDEAPDHPHHIARGSFTHVAGAIQPAPGPVFDRTPVTQPTPPPHRGGDSLDVLREWGFGDAEVGELLRSGAVQASPRD